MKTTFLLICLLLSTTIFAQPKDSIRVMEYRADIDKLVQKITEQQAELADKESKFGAIQSEASSTSSAVAESAADNQKAASKLEGDADSRKMARRARKAAKAASRDSRRARNANDDLEDAEKDIRKLKSKIESNEKKKAKLEEKVVLLVGMPR